MATTVTSKGQVTIPKPVRDHLGIVPGSQVEFRRADDGREARYNVNYREVLSGKAQAIRLIPGDTVFVP